MVKNRETIGEAKKKKKKKEWGDMIFHIKARLSEKKNGKLYFTSLNFTTYYTLHPKFFECTFFTLNFNHCYTLHPDL